MNNKIKIVFKKSVNPLISNLPVLLGVILLISLASTLFRPSMYSWIFGKNIFFNSFIGASLGSLLTGNPITSYILGGEMLEQGVSLIAVTAFLVSWVTVGIVQLPAESILLGKKFAIIRNVLSFIFSIIVALITVFICSL